MLISIVITLCTMAVVVWLSIRANATFGKRTPLPRGEGGLGELGPIVRWNAILLMPIFGGVMFGFLFVTSPYFTLAFIVMAFAAIVGHAFGLFLFSKTLKLKQS
jgi:hypothetical protein